MNSFDKVFGLLGKSLGHSFSKEYFTMKFSELGLNYSYQNIEIDNIDYIVRCISDIKNLKGFNVTIPYKEVIIPFLDRLDDTAKDVGAVNTVRVEEDGSLMGFNTDVIGFERLLMVALSQNKRAISSDKKALLLGNGGASKAVQYVLIKENIPYDVLSRKGQMLTYEKINEIGFGSYSLIVNATPVGMYPNVDECIELPYSTICPDNVFIDLIYNPEETLFLKKARLKNVPFFNGKIMLHEQAEAAWKIWNNNK